LKDSNWLNKQEYTKNVLFCGHGFKEISYFIKFLNPGWAALT